MKMSDSPFYAGLDFFDYPEYELGFIGGIARGIGRAAKGVGRAVSAPVRAASSVVRDVGGVVGGAIGGKKGREIGRKIGRGALAPAVSAFGGKAPAKAFQDVQSAARAVQQVPMARELLAAKTGGAFGGIDRIAAGPAAMIRERMGDAGITAKSSSDYSRQRYEILRAMAIKAKRLPSNDPLRKRLLALLQRELG